MDEKTLARIQDLRARLCDLQQEIYEESISKAQMSVEERAALTAAERLLDRAWEGMILFS